MTAPACIMIVAGEASGDLLGAALMAALQKKIPDARFIGVGGSQMEKQGLKSAFPISELSLMGITEVIPHIPNIFKRLNELVTLQKKEKADFLITIDSPDFTLRLAKKIKAKSKIPCIHYVSPTIWAWRQGRAGKMAKYLDHVLALFPFEPALYEKYNLPCTFVGHPITERFEEPEVLSPEEPLQVALLPGSRAGTIKRMLPLMLESFWRLKKEYPHLKALIPLAHLQQKELVESYLDGKSDITLVPPDERFKALRQCHAAIAASGTSNLELAMMGIPAVIAYKMNNLTHKIAKRLINIPYASPVNWVYDNGQGGQKLLPEFIQDEAIPDNIIKALKPLLQQGPERQKQLTGLAQTRKNLHTEEPPSSKASGIILEHLHHR